MRAQYILNGKVVVEGEFVGYCGGVDANGKRGPDAWVRIREPGTNRIDEVPGHHVRISKTLATGEILAAAERGEMTELCAPWTTAELVSMAEALVQRCETAEGGLLHSFRGARVALENERDRRVQAAAISAHEARVEGVGYSSH